MKILHISFHVGCLNDIQYVFETLGHEISSKKCELPYEITEELAKDYWEKNKDYFQSFDIIITSDTVATSFPFLLNLDILHPFLIIYICNRFDYAMYKIPKFYECLRQVKNNVEKVSLIPYTTFETIWCARKNIFVFESVISIIGKPPKTPYVGKKILSDFGPLNNELNTLGDEKSIFIQTYFNHKVFMNLPKFLSDKGVSVSYGSYNYLSELKKYIGLVVLPDAFCKYFIYEAIQNEIVTFVPSHDFLLELVNKPNYFFNIEGSGGLLTREFVNLCEWYHYPKAHIYFDSFDDLIFKIKNITKGQISDCKKWCRYYGKQIESRSLLQWANTIERIALYK